MTGRRRRIAGSRLPFALAVALRYLKSTRKDAFTSFLSAAAVGGMAVGIAALIVFLAGLSGFQRTLREEILSRTPEIEIELAPGADAVAARRAAESVAGGAAAQIVVRGRGWLVAGDRVRPVEMVGFERRLPVSFPGAAGSAPGLYVGDRLATTWGLEVGEVLEVVSTRPTLSPLGPQPRARRLRLEGTYETGRTEQQERIAVPLAAAEALLSPDERRIVVETGNLETARRLAPRLAERLPPGSTVRTWQELNQALFFALRLEKAVTFVALFLIVVVAALALVSDLTLVISSKQREIGMLGAMGATPAELRRVFLWLGGLLAGIGCGAGLAVGTGGAWALDRYRLLRLPERVFFVEHVPFALETADLAAVLAGALGLALVSAALAARRAAEIRPVEALRR